MNPPIVVLSTGFNPKDTAKHFASIQGQIQRCTHVFIDAAEKPGTAAEHRHRVIHQCSPDTIIVEVDCDDWLARPDALDRVLFEYNLGAWLTWGQFRYDNHAQGWAGPWPTDAKPRRVPWFATHLKTYRAGLFQQIKAHDLKKSDGTWCDKAIDNLVMFPMLEMVGRGRAHYISEVLYVYTGRGTDSASMAEAQRIRDLRPYERLEHAPW